MKKEIGAAVASLILSSTAALAQSAGCIGLDSYNGSSSFKDDIFTTSPFDEGEVITLTADSLTSNQSNAAFYFATAVGTSISNSFVYTLPSGPIVETFVVPVGGIIGLGWQEDTSVGKQTTFTNLALSCSAGVTDGAIQVLDLAQISTAGQQRAIGDALDRNLNGRFDGGGSNFASRNAVFVSTQNAAGNRGARTEYNAWMSLSGRYYWDGYEGYSADVLFGMDRLVTSNTLVGLMIGVGATDLEIDGGAETSTDSVLFGAYGAHEYQSGMMIDGYLAYSSVSYDAGGTQLDTERYHLGISVSGDVETASGVLQPRAGLGAAWEDFPDGVAGITAGYSRQLAATLGVRHDWTAPLGGTNLMPFASIDFEYNTTDGSDGASDEYIAPRLGFGLEGEIGNGYFASSIDIGQAASNVYDAGIDLSYEFRF
jgi:hypothetical protein